MKNTCYQIHHTTFTSAVEVAVSIATDRGYTVDEDDYFHRVTTGPGKPDVDKTFSTTLHLLKDGEEVNHMLVFHVYGLESQYCCYELNAYIS